MPYITPDARLRLDRDGGESNTPGELNYVLTKIIDKYLGPHLTYSSINEVIGVLVCVLLECYRRLAVPYENRKAFVNGDVFQKRASDETSR